MSHCNIVHSQPARWPVAALSRQSCCTFAVRLSVPYICSCIRSCAIQGAPPLHHTPRVSHSSCKGAVATTQLPQNARRPLLRHNDCPMVMLQQFARGACTGCYVRACLQCCASQPCPVQCQPECVQTGAASAAGATQQQSVLGAKVGAN